MFCDKCGAEIKDGIKFCPACGAVVEESEKMTPVKNKEVSNKLVGIVACLVVVFVVACIAKVIFGSNGAEKAAEKYIQAIFEGDMDTYSKYSVLNLKDSLETLVESDEDVRSFMQYTYGTDDPEEVLDKMGEKLTEAMESEFGEGYKVEVEIEDVEECSEYEMQNQLEELEESLGNMTVDVNKIVSIDKIKKMSRVEGKVIVEGEKEVEDNSVRLQVYCAKIGTKWCVLDTSGGVNPIESIEEVEDF